MMIYTNYHDIHKTITTKQLQLQIKTHNQNIKKVTLKDKSFIQQEWNHKKKNINS